MCIYNVFNDDWRQSFLFINFGAFYESINGKNCEKNEKNSYVIQDRNKTELLKTLILKTKFSRVFTLPKIDLLSLGDVSMIFLSFYRFIVGKSLLCLKSSGKSKIPSQP